MDNLLPPKWARFLVWLCASKQLREDALNTFEELHVEAATKFGRRYAYFYSSWHGLRALPYGFYGGCIRIGAAIWKLVA